VIYGQNILLKKIEEVDEIAQTFNDNPYRVQSSYKAEVLELGVEVTLKISVGDKVYFKPGTGHDLEDGTTLVSQSSILANLNK